MAPRRSIQSQTAPTDPAFARPGRRPAKHLVIFDISTA